MVGLDIFRTNADAQWNPVYNAFHRICCCANETIRQQFCKRDLDVANLNLRPSLEQGCGKQTPSQEIIFQSEIATCSKYQNVQETEIQVCVQLRYLRLENRCAVATSQQKTCFNAGKIGFCHCAAVLQMQVPKSCTDLDLGLLYILILGTYSKFAWKIDFLALDVCFLHPYSSAGCRFAASRSRSNHCHLIESLSQKRTG